MTYTKLNPEFKAAWVAALRSGEYQQGESILYYRGKYCCLGVACIVAGLGKEEILGIPLIDRKNMVDDYPMLSPISSVGIKSLSDAAATLTKMNDIEDKSFNEIADWIEENL